MPEPLTKEEREDIVGDIERLRATQPTRCLITHDQWSILRFAATVAALEKELAALVRCADCRYWIRIDGNEGDCTAHRLTIVSKGDCYCSWGERKDG